MFLDMVWADEKQRQVFLQAHEQEHHLLNEASTDMGLAGLMYPLGDWEHDKQGWMRNHAQIHNNLAANVSLDAPPDLEEWDLDDPDQAQNWLLDHLADHDRLATAYGVLT